MMKKIRKRRWRRKGEDNGAEGDDDANHLHAIDISAGEEGYRGDSNTPTQEDKNLSSVILKIL